MRLDEPLLHALPSEVQRPRYDRSRLHCGIVHLGIGAFARAHLAAVNEETIERTGDLRFGITGVSLRSTDTRDALTPQHGLYCLALRDSRGDGAIREKLRVIGNLVDLVVMPEQPTAVIRRIADPATRIVSLTVTEKGYAADPAIDGLVGATIDAAPIDTPPIVSRLAAARRLTTVSTLVSGLKARREAGVAPLSVVSLDNLASNGDRLRAIAIAFAGQFDPALAKWIEQGCSFPNSMVDRIVPQTTDADRSHVAHVLGMEDAWPVVAEPYLKWAVEDRFALERPHWDLGGANFVSSIEPYERLKLRLVNACHTALACLSVVAGVRTVDQAMRLHGMVGYLRALIRTEVVPSLDVLPGLDPIPFGEELLVRFSNAALAHRTQQIASDSSQKLPQRVLPTIRANLRAGRPSPRLALATAAWARYLEGVDETGETYAVVDPLADALRALSRAGQEASASAADALALERARLKPLLSFAPVFGELAHSEAFLQEVASQALVLRQGGVDAAIKRLATTGAVA